VHGYVNIGPYVKVVQFAVQARHIKSPPLGCFLKAILCPAAEVKVYPKILETSRLWAKGPGGGAGTAQTVKGRQE
jgi:hypothetical protein